MCCTLLSTRYFSCPKTTDTAQSHADSEGQRKYLKLGNQLPISHRRGCRALFECHLCHVARTCLLLLVNAYAHLMAAADSLDLSW